MIMMMSKSLRLTKENCYFCSRILIISMLFLAALAKVTFYILLKQYNGIKKLESRSLSQRNGVFN